MRKNRTLSRAERVLAVALSAIWLGGGAFTMYFALLQGRWGMALVALATLLYGGAWLRVAARSRLLTWHEFIAPWRRS